MKKQFYLLTAFIAVVIASYMFFSKEKPLTVNKATSPSLEKRVVAATEEKMEPQKMTAPAKEKLSAISASEIRLLHDTFPSKKQVNEEFKTNPHTPPKSLMTFAKQLGPLMEKAFVNETDANILMRELHVCAQDESVATAARALCVQDTEKLAKYHPQMKNMAIELRASISPEVQKILDTNDAFIKKSE